MSFLIFITVLVTLAVAFVNGMTDAPNAIVSCVSTGCISLRKAVILAAIFDFAGSVTLGMLNGNVTRTVIDIAAFADSRSALIGLSAAMLSVVLWAVGAWVFGIPTSESHALISALAGAGIAANNGVLNINSLALKKVLLGLLISVFAGFISGYLISKLSKSFFDNRENENMYTKAQIISSVFMAYMHGAQDSQKFTGIIMLALSASDIFEQGKSDFLFYVLCPVFISAGTVSGGERIIKKIGSNMLEMKNEQGFSSDVAGSLCLLFSTLMGMPVSTTHTKTCAVLGAGVASSDSVNWKTAGEMATAWLVTFPACSLLGWLLTKLFFFFG